MKTGFPGLVGRHTCVAAVLLSFLIPSGAWALPKGHQLLIDHGLQLQGMVTKDDNFDLETYQNANYTSINWLWASNTSLHGAAPGAAWARWASSADDMPHNTPAEAPYLSKLLAVQLSDEQNLNDPAIRNNAVNWFNSVRTQYPNTILYANSFGGQVGDAELDDFLNRAKPDMISFDTYPFRSTYVPGQTGDARIGAPIGGSPTNWYGDLRRYREHAKNHSIPLAVYTQTFHAVQDYDQTVYRNPSQSELRLNTNAALAFSAKYLTGFTYNTGAASLFNPPGGDSNPNALYNEQKETNRRALNLGKALVHLTPIHDLRPKPAGEAPSIFTSDDPNFPASTTTSILFHRGRFGGGSSSEVYPLPIGFVADPAAPNTYSWWEFGKNDPYLTGWGRTNLGTVDNGRVGDVLFSWFKPLDATKDDPNDVDDQLYLMVVNGLTSPTATAEEARQRITLDFLNTIPGLLELDSDTGEVKNVSLQNVGGGKLRLTLELDGGSSALFKFDSSTPFIGIPEPASVSILGFVALSLLRHRKFDQTPQPPSNN